MDGYKARGNQMLYLMASHGEDVRRENGGITPADHTSVPSRVLSPFQGYLSPYDGADCGSVRIREDPKRGPEAA